MYTSPEAINSLIKQIGSDFYSSELIANCARVSPQLMFWAFAPLAHAKSDRCNFGWYA